MTKRHKEFSEETPVAKKIKREDNLENKTATSLLDLPSEILVEILENLSFNDLNNLSLVNTILHDIINGNSDDESQYPLRVEYAMALRQFDCTLTPQLMTHKEYLLKLSKYRISAQHKEIEYIKKNWDECNWRRIDTDIHEKIKSFTAPANTLEEFQKREQWLNDINEKTIRSYLNTNNDTLYLCWKKLTRFPATLFKDENLIEYWQKLSILCLPGNQLAQLPTELGNLPRLVRLELNNNQLTLLPAEIGNLPALKNLFLEHNQLTKLPDEIGNLLTLERLYLSHNLLTQLPAKLRKLERLQFMALRYNQLVFEQLTPFKLRMGERWYEETLRTQTLVPCRALPRPKT